ncbi:hypothetical protein AVEN_253201-1 [Araneus ventricosus]|uniref:K Homology domain-containing protein n=1 Tax=Araneus ventricosus TaxID=182803 RepID=A0A4Y2PP09_ARAVE|nr:hypothetical protein AVEN_253201-1 [Araneus ventricosus]
MLRAVNDTAERALLRSFQLTVEVDPQYHPNIIGRNGAVISKIRKDHNVQIYFPERYSANDRVITITGHEKDTKAACPTTCTLTPPEGIFLN